MPVVSNTQPSPIFELKHASLAALALVLKSADLELLAQALEEQFAATPGLFDHDPVVIDLSQVADDAGALDFAVLQTLLRARRMLPVAVTGGSSEQMQAALVAGLSESSMLAPLRPESSQPAPLPEAAPRSSEPIAVAPLASTTLVIDRPLRSGQQVYAKGGDLVVLAAVNFGAEVIADGHIHVYAPLRGRAIAGARGNTAARIFSTCMEPQLVAIAGTYRTTETALPPDVLSRPAQVWLDGDALVVEPLQALKH